MKVKTVTGGIIPENCYLFLDENSGKAAVVDPGFSSQALQQALDEVGRENIVAVLLTHGHFDHIAEAASIQKETGAPIYFPEKELPFLTDQNLSLSYMVPEGIVKPFVPDVLVKEGTEISVGTLRVKVLETPGHTQGSCCYQVESALFTGDTLFFCSAGRTDFPTGSAPALFSSLRRLRDLKENYTVYPGHEGATTLDYERRYNPYMTSFAE